MAHNASGHNLTTNDFGKATDRLTQALRWIVGDKWVRDTPRDLRLYSYDAAGSGPLPRAVVFPSTTSEVSAILQLTAQEHIPVVPRGAGTCLSGGAQAVEGGVTISLVRMKAIRRLDPRARLAVVEAGVTNHALQVAAQQHGLFFDPDPSSMKAATIGGCVAENAGGPRGAKYGVTTNHVLGLEVVLADGRVIGLGGELEEPFGLDLRGCIVGSEGTLGVVTAAAVRLLPNPLDRRTMLAVFEGATVAMGVVSHLIAARITPAALELLDRNLLAVIEQGAPGTFPQGAGSVLLIEVDGDPADLDSQVVRIAGIVDSHGALSFTVAEDESEREALWAARRGGYGALARVSPSILTMDVTVPRDALVSMFETSSSCR